MDDSVPIPSISLCVELFGNDKGNILHRELCSSEFRSAPSLHDQILFVKKMHPELTVKQITSQLGICIKRYYKALKNEVNPTFTRAKPPQHQLLTGEEEKAIIDKIHEQQLLYDCWESIDIRNYASEIYRKKLLLKKLSYMIR